ncbi:MAG: hypothetical protein B6244_07210 [Candidatus Cloacimonetes bacterium 4572_55]|nr:MAG: hypothetical protein B6244_07210 [Candidatus Cloacimonetes bacterium 4572_55]
MGLFNFLRNVGSGKKEAEAIKKKLEEELGNRLHDLKVDILDDDAVALYGRADSQAVKEKAILIAGNTKGVEKVNALNLRAPKPRKPKPKVVVEKVKPVVEEPVVEEKEEELISTFYTIQSGDTLWKIAKNHYGDGNKYHKIFEANLEVIKNADKIYPGQTIRLPKIEDIS